MAPPAPAITRTLTGTVLPSLMQRAVKVRTTKQTYNAFLKKHFLVHPTYHVADPTSSCHAGDVIRFTGPWPLSKSKNIKHVVTEIVSPWGKGVDERPRVLTEGHVRGLLEGRGKNKGRREGGEKASEVEMGLAADEENEGGMEESKDDQTQRDQVKERDAKEKAEREGIVNEEEKAPEGKETREKIIGDAAS